MKILSSIVKFLLLVLWVLGSQADISLTLGNKQYLPPPIQELPVEDNNTQQRQKVEEKNYGNSRYEIFEVHHHYEPSKFKGEKNNYSGLQKKPAKEIRIEHINAPKGFPLDDPNLDASYLSIAAGNDESNKQIIIQHEVKTNIPVPFPSNYRHTFPEKSNKNNNIGAVQQSFLSVEQHQGQQHVFNKFKGPDYLPPKSQAQEYSTNPAQNTFAKQVHQTSQQFEHKRSEDRFRSPDYLPPKQHGLSSPQHNSAFKGPGYLPPLQPPHQHRSLHSNENLGQNTSFGVHNNLQFHQHSSVQSDQQFMTKPQFKGSDYLPPQQKTPHQSTFNDAGNLSQEKGKDFNPSLSFKGPGYFPPENSQNTEYKRPEYLPPHQQQQETPNENVAFRNSDHLRLQQQSNKSFKGPGYLPPQQSESEAAFKGPDYLPPLGNGVEQHQPQVQSLPPGYDFDKPPNAEEAIAELHKLPEESLDPQTPLAGYTQSSNINRNTPELSDSKDDVGYDFQKPKNSEQARNLLHNEAITTNIEPHKVSGHSLPVYHFQKSLNQVHESDSSKQQNLPDNDLQFKGPDYLPPTTGSQTYNGPNHLPATLGSEALNNRNYLSSTTGSQNYKEPLPPVQSEQTDAYFPSTNPTNNQILNPLSSYMSNVKPYDRYGNRRPFSEYGLPPSKATTFISSNDLSPMYREPASRPQFYAPTMYYTNNAFNSETSATYAQKQHQSTSAFSQQTLQALQTFMPQDLQQTNSISTSHYNAPNTASLAQTTFPTIKPSTSKIRTVQIFNPSAVKTLKVLESLDNAGVKTIKILGPSHEQPMGDHRVVKVVSGSHQQSVQTVKIFNDHQDVTPNANDAVTVEKSNSYLPPRGKRNSNNKTKT